MPDKSRSRTPRRSPVAAPQDVESIEVDGSDASQDEDDQDEDDLGFEVDMAGDEGQRVKPCARRSLKQLSKTSLFVTEEDVARAAEAWQVVGCSQRVEKSYKRLTSAPRPEDVRPEPVLEEALRSCRRRWESERNWAYVSDQLRAIRQDLVVQRSRSHFACRAYETCARLALEAQDLGQFHQCQVQVLSVFQSTGCCELLVVLLLFVVICDLKYVI
ncbi:unnamed protein product [Polarella glacialis]|uniref:SAC3/GANP/THP3 conserved domain-containing protein n=1 Tax=Polarella glacialis TaxID=89957 RepID=A0A813FRZ3_POLGL|nr:unnamed protein product [Polarella glacialis]